jgi:hypothetical protein
MTIPAQLGMRGKESDKKVAHLMESEFFSRNKCEFFRERSTFTGRLEKCFH